MWQQFYLLEIAHFACNFLLDLDSYQIRKENTHKSAV